MECGATETAQAGAESSQARAEDDACRRDACEWLRCIARISPVAIFRADAKGRCIYANERWTELTGYSQEAALGKGWEKAIHPEDLPRLLEEWERTLRLGNLFRMEFRYLRPDGTIVWALGQSVEERDAGGQLVGYVSTVTDISELRRMREELQRSHADLEEHVRQRTAQWEHMAMIVAASADAIVSSDLSGKVVSWNKAAEMIFGYTAEEMIGKTSYVITPPDQLKEAEMIKARARAGERVDHLETVRVARSGELIEVLISVFPLRDPAGHIFGTSAVLRDIRKEKKAERRASRLSGRLLRLQDEERRRLARDLHDSTAQSLVALSVNLALLNTEKDAPPEKRAAWLAVSQALAESAGRELRTHAYLLHPPLLDERGLPAALRWFVEGFAERSGLKVELDLETEVGRLPQLTEVTVFRVVQESLSNVHRHAKTAMARVRVGRADGWITVEVRDAGCGIDRDINELVGVGIAGMRERLAQIGGELRIESDSAGTAVMARIPDR